MELTELRRLVRRGEGTNIEFKKKVKHPEKVAREVVAFANTSGGYLIIGVEDNKNIVGLKDYFEEIYEFERIIEYFCYPTIEFIKHEIELPNQLIVLAYEIKAGTNGPYYARPAVDQKGFAYLRIDDQSVKASTEAYLILCNRFNNRNQKLTIGPNEQTLLKHLEKVEHITLDDFVKIANLKKFIASRILVNMVSANILRIIPKQNGDIFYFNND